MSGRHQSHLGVDFDPARGAVFLDFDGTISVTDIGTHLLERLGDPRWRELEELYVAGRLGSRVCLEQQWACLPPDEDRVRAVAAEVALDPGAAPLVAALRERGCEVTVLSDGFGFYIPAAVAGWGVRVLTNQVDFPAHRLVLPEVDPSCPCGACGTCKRLPLLEAAGRGRIVVLVGDGASDRPAVPVADLVFAKGDLAGWCGREGIDHIPFESLADVHAVLLGAG